MKSNIDNIVKPKAGDPITESMLTSIIDSIDVLKSRLSADNSPEYVNPAIVRCVNGLNVELPIFSVVHLGNATITDRSFFNSSGGATQDARIRATQPTGAEDEPFGVIRSAVGPGFEVSAVCSGFTCCKIKVDNSKQENYKYAKPIKNVTGYFQAAESGPCLIVWKESGTGEKWGYVIIDRRGQNPLLCASEMPNTDARPQGAFELDSSDTWLYADSLDSFGTENDDFPPKVANPCGYPEDRPVIVGRVQGFPGDESEEESTGSNSSSGNRDGESSESGESSSGSSSLSGSEDEAEVDLVAIACDTREFFMINNGTGIGAGENPPNGNPGIYKKGSLHYIKYDSSSGRWIPANEEDEESTGSNSGSTGTGGTEEETSGNGSYNYRLAVCQRNMPAGWNVEFRMPYYAPEMNYGAEPESEGDFQERCGVLPGEHKFSKKRLDYHYVNKRYSYEPRFVFIGNAVGYGSGVGLVIEGKTYQVDFPTPRSSTSYPDVYSGDQITVEVDARGDEPVLTAIDYPMDFPKGTIIASYTDLRSSPHRGWQDVTDGEEGKYTNDIGSADLLVLKVKSGGKKIADLRTHQCTCECNNGGGTSSGADTSSGTSSNSSSGGHYCPHEEVTTAVATFRWYQKIKGSALI